MKTAIYIENGFVQLVLTPENKFEKDALLGVCGEPELSYYGEARRMNAWVKRASFYHCQGGYVRTSSDDSLILTNKPEVQQDPTTAPQEKP